MTTDLYNNEGKVIDKIELPDRLFSRSWNPDLVHQALKAQEANKRQMIAHVKGRGEVSGGGKKPWRQKGTGRARHGSIRSPIWAGGGVTHGPTKEKKFTLKINQKMRQRAIFSVLSRRLEEGEVKIVDSLAISEAKTKLLADLLRKFLSGRSSALLILGAKDNLPRASQNLSRVKTLDPQSLNIYDLLRYKQILLEKDSIPVIEKHYHAVE